MKSPLAALLGAAVLASAPAVEAAEVHETMEIAASPETIWETIGDFGSLDGWLPGIAECEITEGQDHQVGAVRKLTLDDGGQVVEELLAYDAAGHSLTYSIVEAPLPVRNYRSTLSVHETATGSRVEWRGTYEGGPELRAVFEGLYQGGLGNLKQMLENH